MFACDWRVALTASCRGAVLVEVCCRSALKISLDDEEPPPLNSEDSRSVAELPEEEDEPPNREEVMSLLLLLPEAKREDRRPFGELLALLP